MGHILNMKEILRNLLEEAAIKNNLSKMNFVKSILGGLMIAIASYIYLSVGGIVGAIMFSIGLLTILNM